MANYTESFLRALQGASSSVSGLVSQIREPDFEEKVRIETDAQKEVLNEQAEATKNLQSYLLGEKHGYDLSLAELGYGEEYKLEALRAVNQMQLQALRGEQAMDQIRYETAQKLEEAGYDAMVSLGQVNFVGDAMDPGEWQGFSVETLKRFVTRDRGRATEAKQQFEQQYNLLNVGLADVLQTKTINPNAPAVQQAIDTINTGIETAENLATFSGRQNFGEDQDYYNNRLEQLYALRDTLEQ
jgi:hypothetical protein